MEDLFLRLIGDKTLSLALGEVKFKESAILDGCIEYFDDRNPCFIHKSAVKARFIEEIQGNYRGADTILSQSITDKIYFEGLKQAIIFKKEKDT